jgi:hypothetical protein
MNKLSRAAMGQRLDDADAERKLRDMLTDLSLNTGASYSANSDLYPDNKIPFVEKHMAYLMEHPKLEVDHYLSNLRLMLKKRS